MFASAKKEKKRSPSNRKSSRIVTVLIRSGKGLIGNLKRVIVKNPQIDNSPDSEIPHILIDIENDNFYASANSAVGVPPHLMGSRTAKQQIKGYAKILQDVMNVLHGRLDTTSASVLELLKPKFQVLN